MASPRKQRLFTALLCVLVVLGIFFVQDPAYSPQQKEVIRRLKNLALISHGYSQRQLEFRELGFIAFPTLIEFLSAEDSPRVKTRLLLRRQFGLFPDTMSAEQKHALALYGFQAMRTTAEPAIPALTNLIHSGRASIRPVEALEAIGGHALPATFCALRSKDSAVRRHALSRLIRFGASRQVSSELVRQECLLALKEQDPEIQWQALLFFEFTGDLRPGPRRDIRGSAQAVDEIARRLLSQLVQTTSPPRNPI